MKRNGTVSYSHVFVSRRSVECQLVKTLPSFFIMFGLIWIFSWSCLNRNHMIILYVCEFCFCFFIYLIVQFCNFLDCHGFGLLSMPSHAHFSSAKILVLAFSDSFKEVLETLLRTRLIITHPGFSLIGIFSSF